VGASLGSYLEAFQIWKAVTHVCGRCSESGVPVGNRRKTFGNARKHTHKNVANGKNTENTSNKLETCNRETQNETWPANWNKTLPNTTCRKCCESKYTYMYICIYIYIYIFNNYQNDQLEDHISQGLKEQSTQCFAISTAQQSMNLYSTSCSHAQEPAKWATRLPCYICKLARDTPAPILSWEIKTSHKIIGSNNFLELWVLDPGTAPAELGWKFRANLRCSCVRISYKGPDRDLYNIANL